MMSLDEAYTMALQTLNDGQRSLIIHIMRSPHNAVPATIRSANTMMAAIPENKKFK